MQVELNATVSLHSEVKLRRYPQGNLVCAFGTSQAFEVNDIGALVLSSLENPVVVAELVAKLLDTFKGTDGIEEDILLFLGECVELNILLYQPNNETLK